LLLATNFVGHLIKYDLFYEFCGFDIDGMVNQGRKRSWR